MTEILVVGFIVVWFIYWGWMLVHKPDTVMAVWKKSDDSMKTAVGGAARVVGTVVKHLPKK